MVPDEKTNVFKPFSDEDPFQFDCHPGISCFTECCAKLRLLLTPYDILRMKNRLNISSDQFLDQYTDTLLDPHSRFPMVKLRMGEGKGHRCPFVSPKGCSIYEDRPEACRLYPVGRASAPAARETETREKYFVVNETHCCGFREEKKWSLKEWLNHEGVKEYKTINDQWMGIMTSSKSLGPKDHIPRKHQMFFMASYNLDKFRAFLFQSKFFDHFEVNNELKERMETDDVALLRFGFDWLRFSLFGEKTLPVKQ
ncbi:MAG: YkgJ family cysteine cluster protein [Deltaproteobacteria bacterium]|nr:YkgJ family cysteine cluster protein [Deltaproteobacteria bacterium]